MSIHRSASLTAASLILLSACSGDTSSNGSSDATIDAGAETLADATADIDCSRVGCAPPPPCGEPCTAPCGCCFDPSCADTGGVDARDAAADASEDGGACTGWDADWGDTPKPDVSGVTPCRGVCDCPSGFHCCAGSLGTVCAPAAECP